uniref:Uncharacterized protein n=1 Tax=Romanomermis culicivorax TaxID=13658 RepID=A0A915HU46_ROMCU
MPQHYGRIGFKPVPANSAPDIIKYTMGTVEKSQHEKKYHSRRKETVGQSQQSKNRNCWRIEMVGESEWNEKNQYKYGSQNKAKKSLGAFLGTFA